MLFDPDQIKERNYLNAIERASKVVYYSATEKDRFERAVAEAERIGNEFPLESGADARLSVLRAILDGADKEANKITLE